MVLVMLCAMSCQKEESVTPKSKVSDALVGAKKGEAIVSGMLKSVTQQDAQASQPFTIFCAGVSETSGCLGLIYHRTELQSKFSVLWDGKYEQKDGYTLINLTVIRENTGTLLTEMTYDSTFVSLKNMGISIDKLRQPKTAVKFHNASNPSSVALVELEDAYGCWPK